MSENVLKKQFKEKDVNRLRNIFSKNAGNKTLIQSGYSKEEIKYNEGDVWEENGKQWTIQDGIKQSISKLDNAKQLSHFPLFCPSCNKIMKHKNDKQFWTLYNRCFNCQVDFETELRINGLWETYQTKILNEGIDNLIRDYEEWVDEMLNDKGQSYITEAGDIERWTGGVDIKRVLESKQQTIEFLKKLKKDDNT
jgi:hypothetical protein